MLCKAIHASREDQTREDQDETIAYLMGDEFYDEATDHKISTSTRWPQPIGKNFNTSSLCAWVDVKKADGTSRDQAGGQGTRQRNRSSNVRGNSSSEALKMS